jgi:hypothetical protein
MATDHFPVSTRRFSGEPTVAEPVAEGRFDFVEPAHADRRQHRPDRRDIASPPRTRDPHAARRGWFEAQRIASRVSAEASGASNW